MKHVHYYEPSTIDPKQAKRVFNPRFIDTEDDTASQVNLQNNLPYLEVDEFKQTMKIYNFSQRMCHIGHRDGSVTTLRNTSPAELTGRQCYLAYMPRKVNGKRVKPLNEVKHQTVPEIPEGIYICLEKTISCSARTGTRGMSSLMWTTKDKKIVVGDDIRDIIEADMATQSTYYYRPFHNQPDVQELAYDGPTIYTGEEEQTSRYQRYHKSKERRYYETFYIEYFIPMKDLVNHENNYLYIENLDLCLSVGLNPADVIHPYSERGKAQRALQQCSPSIDINDIRHFSGINIVNVDNTNKGSVGQYFVNLGGKVIAINPVVNASLPDGLHLYLNNQATDDNPQNHQSETIHLTHSEALGHQLPDIPKFYRTYQEAYYHGDLLQQRNREEAERDFERKSALAQLKADLLEKQAEVDMLKKEIEVERAKLKDYYEQKSAARSDHYEERSSSRKDSSEHLKWIVGVGGLILGIAIKAIF